MTMNQLKKLNIFVVDDDMFYLNTLGQHLRNLGYTKLYLFTSGSDCLKNIDENPDVVFLDYDLGSMTGNEVLQKIKSYNPAISVVIISGQEEIKPVLDTLKYGAFDYIQKGDLEEDKIKHALERIESLV